MSETWFDLAPPATWQRFEELCADTFEAVFRDPALVRYGRSGQSQSGVDIVATDGAFWPIGIQCKQKGRWPVKALTKNEIDAEVGKARKFTPTLAAFYIVTTAPIDKALTDHAAALTNAHRAEGLFPVHVFGWQEVCRRATLHPAVARKHFGIYGGEGPGPLLATFVTKAGCLILDDSELGLAVRELRHAWRAAPSGRLLVRQRESDELMARIQAILLPNATMADRLARVELQDELEILEDGEERVEAALRLLLTDQDLEYYPGSLYPKHAAAMVRSIVERRLNRGAPRPGGDYKLKLASPLDPEEGVSCFLRPEQAYEIRRVIEDRRTIFDRDATNTLAELPPGVMSTVAVPLVLDLIVQRLHEGATIDALRRRGLLRIGSWKILRPY